MIDQTLEPWRWRVWLRAEPKKAVRNLSARTRLEAMKLGARRLDAVIHSRFGSDPDIAAVDAEVERAPRKAAA